MRTTVILLLILFMAAGFVFFQGSYFRLRVLTVEGACLLSADEIGGQAGLQGGEHLYSFSLGSIQERLLEHPRIARVQVCRRLPGQVVVSVVERKTVAVLSYHQVFLQVDADGVVIDITGAWPGLSVPLISGVDVGQIELGQALDTPGLDIALHCASSLGRLGADISEIFYDTDCLRLYRLDGLPILFPTDRQAVTHAADALEGILATGEVDTQEVLEVDLRAPNHPVVRPRVRQETGQGN